MYPVGVNPRSNKLDALAARQMDEMSFARQSNDSLCTLFPASIINFRDQAGKRLGLFLSIAFHGPTINRQAIPIPWGISAPWERWRPRRRMDDAETRSLTQRSQRPQRKIHRVSIVRTDPLTTLRQPPIRAKRLGVRQPSGALSSAGGWKVVNTRDRPLYADEPSALLSIKTTTLLV